MPTILRIGPYRLFFYSAEGQEPIHVHVERDRNIAKFWIRPTRLANSGGFRPSEISDIFKIVEENTILIERSWNEHFAG